MYGVANTSDSMILGSPVSSANTSLHQPAYYPSLYDSSYGLGSSPAGHRLMRTPSATGGHSPPKHANRHLVSPPSQSLLMGGGATFTPRSDHRPHGRDFSLRVKEKSGAPPTMGLFDQIASPVSAVNSPLTMGFQRNFDSSGIQSQYDHQTVTSSTMIDYDSSFQQKNTSVRSEFPPQSGIFSPRDTGGASVMMSADRHAPPSPTQVDPFYTQGELIRPDERLEETWITVFGFSAAATSFILQQFSQYGNILQHVIAPEGNWMHLHYQSKIQAKKALSKNGKVFGNGIMVGVRPCIDKQMMDFHREDSVNMSHLTSLSMAQTPTRTPLTPLHTSILSTTTAPGAGPYLPSGSTPIQQIGAVGAGSFSTPTDGIRRTHTPGMRPLTSALRVANSDQDVLNKTNTPQRSSGVIGKALEYMFGW